MWEFKVKKAKNKNLIAKKLNCEKLFNLLIVV